MSRSAGQPASAADAKVTSASHPLHVDVLQAGDGSLGMCVLPGRRKGKAYRDAAVDCRRLKDDLGASMLVTLVKQVELEMMENPLYSVAPEMGLQHVHYEVRDKWIPMDMQEYHEQVVQPVCERLRAGELVVVHCNGGKGRTGTLVVACLLKLGVVETVGEAVARTREARGGTIRNPLQIAFLYEFAAWLGGGV